MENKNYRINRDEVYFGEVINTGRIYRDISGDIENETGKLCAGSYYSYRNILFVPDENNHANDLLYNSPKYPVLNLTHDSEIIYLDGKNTLVQDAVNLAAVLQTFGFKQELTYKDVQLIRHTLLNSQYLKKHCELFGFEEDEWGFHSSFMEHPLKDYFTVLRNRCDKTLGEAMYHDIKMKPFKPSKKEVPIRKIGSR